MTPSSFVEKSARLEMRITQISSLAAVTYHSAPKLQQKVLRAMLDQNNEY